MHRLAVFLLVLGSLPVVASGRPAHARQQATGATEGTVADAETGEVLPEVGILVPSAPRQTSEEQDGPCWTPASQRSPRHGDGQQRSISDRGHPARLVSRGGHVRSHRRIAKSIVVSSRGGLTDKARGAESQEGGLRYQTDCGLTNQARRSGESMQVRLRYKAPGGDTSRLPTQAVPAAGRGGARSEDFAFTAGQARALAEEGRGDDPYGDRDEFIQLVERFPALTRDTDEEASASWR